MPTATASNPEIVPPPELEIAWHSHPAIVKYGDPILRQVARPVIRINDEIRTLIQQMSILMKDANGIGLAAPQVGFSHRLFIYDMGEGVRVLINPKIVAMKGEQREPVEGCLSMPGLIGEVKRAMEVRVKGYDERGRPISRRATELEARVIQHEIDHLDGILFIDRADPDSLAWAIEDPDSEETTELPLSTRE